MNYDLIGDIHGEFDTLVTLLRKLNYDCIDGAWQHPSRKVIFLGDFIDRGRMQKAVLDLVMPMVNRGHALAVMGNHEFNALAFHTKNAANDGWLRPRYDKNIRQHLAFLNEYLNDESSLKEALAFFKTLPLWLDLDGIRVVHACWSQDIVDQLKKVYAGAKLTEDLLVAASMKGTPEYEWLETLLKGKELKLPNEISFIDKEGTERHHIRVKWWDTEVSTVREAYVGPENARNSIPNDDIRGEHLIEYSREAPPVFLGHYWLSGKPSRLTENVACLDYSVARPGGKLVAYQWSGESILNDENFVWVEREMQNI